MRPGRFAAVVASVALLVRAGAVEIVDDPVFRFVGPHDVEIRWTTDVPASSQVDYAINPPAIQTINNPALVTQHAMVVANLQPGQPYDFFISSGAGDQTAEAADFLYIPPAPVVIQEPAKATPDALPPLVTGVVQIIAAAAHPSVKIQSVSFLYVGPDGGTPVPIGTDSDGTGVIANTFEEAPTGDGWSVDWDTTNLPEGAYQLIAQVQTSIGQFPAKSDVVVDHQPPKPVLLSPVSGDVARGIVQLRAEGGQGSEAQFDYQGPVDALLSFSPAGLAQTNYPFDGNKGQMMCDPTSQAAILLGDPDFRKALEAEPSFQKAVKKLCKEPAKVEECIARLVVRALAEAKGSGSGGTARDGEIAGSNRLLKGLRLPWRYERKPDKKKDGQSYTFKELKACSSMAGVRGVVVHIHPCGNINGTGHAIALKSVEDTPNPNGTFKVTFMDPATGQDASFDVSPNGSFTYGKGLVCIRSMGSFIGQRPPAQLQDLTEAGWQLIGTDAVGADDWEAMWNTSGLRSGFYWLRVRLTDSQNRSGEDFAEVFVAPPLLSIQRRGADVVARWPKDATNYRLSFNTNLLGGIPLPVEWKPLVAPIVVEGSENTVELEPKAPAGFLRLKEA